MAFLHLAGVAAVEIDPARGWSCHRLEVDDAVDPSRQHRLGRRHRQAERLGEQGGDTDRERLGRMKIAGSGEGRGQAVDQVGDGGAGLLLGSGRLPGRAGCRLRRQAGRACRRGLAWWLDGLWCRCGPPRLGSLGGGLGRARARLGCVAGCRLRRRALRHRVPPGDRRTRWRSWGAALAGRWCWWWRWLAGLRRAMLVRRQPLKDTRADPGHGRSTPLTDVAVGKPTRSIGTDLPWRRFGASPSLLTPQPLLGRAPKTHGHGFDCCNCVPDHAAALSVRWSVKIPAADLHFVSLGHALV